MKETLQRRLRRNSRRQKRERVASLKPKKIPQEGMCPMPMTGQVGSGPKTVSGMRNTGHSDLNKSNTGEGVRAKPVWKGVTKE